MSFEVREAGGVKRRRGGGGGGGMGEGSEEKIRAPQYRLGNSLWRSMKIIGNPLEKRSTYGHEGVFVKINLMFTCHFTRIDCEVTLITLTIWTSTSGSKNGK